METYEKVFSVVAWSFKVLWSGLHPTKRPSLKQPKPNFQTSHVFGRVVEKTLASQGFAPLGWRGHSMNLAFLMLVLCRGMMEHHGTIHKQAYHCRRVSWPASVVTGSSSVMCLDSQAGIDKGETQERPKYTNWMS